METIIFILFGINAIISIYYIGLMFKSNKLKKITEKFKIQDNSEALNKIKGMNLLPRIIVIIFLIIFMLLVFAIGLIVTGFFIWIPIMIVIIHDWKLGVLTFVGCSILISVIWSWIISKNRTNIKDGEEAVIREYIFLSILLQLVIIVYFSKNMNFDVSMEFIYTNVPVFTNTVTILYPIFFFGILISNLYLYFHFIRTKLKKIPQWKIKGTDVLLIFVVSSFLGLLLISESKLYFVNNMDSFLRTLDIVKIFLTAILVPLVFYKLKGETNGRNEKA